MWRSSNVRKIYSSLTLSLSSCHCHKELNPHFSDQGNSICNHPPSPNKKKTNILFFLFRWCMHSLSKYDVGMVTGYAHCTSRKGITKAFVWMREEILWCVPRASELGHVSFFFFFRTRYSCEVSVCVYGWMMGEQLSLIVWSVLFGLHILQCHWFVGRVCYGVLSALGSHEWNSRWNAFGFDFFFDFEAIYN